MRIALLLCYALSLVGCGIFGDTNSVDLRTDAGTREVDADASPDAPKLDASGDMTSVRDGGTDPDGCGGVEFSDTSTSDAVVGDGTAESCTEDAFDTALTTGGVITFDCGPDPVTIPITSTKSLTSDVTIDGGSKVTISGGNAVALFQVETSSPSPSPVVTFQRIDLIDGHHSGDQTRCGAAIQRVGGTLNLFDVTLEGHTCEASAGGTARVGGALVLRQGGPTTIANSTFRDNEADAGGAIWSSATDVRIVDSAIIANRARTTFGGALASEGSGAQWLVCGTRFQDNRAAGAGGAIYHVGTMAEDTMRIDRSVFTRNRSDDSGGAAYLDGLPATVTNSSFTGNVGVGGGALRFQDARVDMMNSTVYDNESTSGLGGGIMLQGATGAITNTTIVGNRAPNIASFAGGLAGGTVSLKNSIIADNTGGNAYESQNCNVTQEDGGGNLQWPETNPAEQAENPCAEGALFADPVIGEFGDHGGLTPTLPVAPDSPAHDHGRDCPDTDQRGVARSADRCTAGAYELE